MSLRRLLATTAGAIGITSALIGQVAGSEPRDPVVRAEPPPPPRSVLARRPSPEIVFEAPGIPGSGAVQELYTMNLDGSELRQITHDGLNKFLAHFSPDGTTCAGPTLPGRATTGFSSPSART